MLLRNAASPVRIFTLSVTLMMAALGPANAGAVTNPPVPRIKPAAPNSSQFLTKTDAKTFRLGLAAADRRNWTDVDRRIKALSDPGHSISIRLAANDPHPIKSRKRIT